MSTLAAGAPGVRTLLRLGRMSNVPTVWTNVVAGAVMAAAISPAAVVLVGLAVSAFYVGGMYLNDFFDREIDARERPGRPIGAGEIGAPAVSAIGLGLLVAGILMLAPLGAVAWGIALAAVIVLYDIWHKGNPFGPVLMGCCRALVYFVAAAATGGASGAVALAALALACHVAGLTYAARQESLNRIERLWPLGLLAVPLLVAAPAMANGIVVGFAALLLTADAFAIRLLVRRPGPDAVPRAVSILIAGICLVDALAIAAAGGDVRIALACTAGYPLTRLFQMSIPGT